MPTVYPASLGRHVYMSVLVYMVSPTTLSIHILENLDQMTSLFSHTWVSKEQKPLSPFRLLCVTVWIYCCFLKRIKKPKA